MYDDISDYIPDTKRRSTTNDREKSQYDNDSRRKNYFFNDGKSVCVLFISFLKSFMRIYLE